MKFLYRAKFIFGCFVFLDLDTGQIIWSSVATTANTTWTDNDVTINSASQTIFYYKVTAVDVDSNESDYSNTVSTHGYWVPKDLAEQSKNRMQMIPQQITLYQNYPNPFNAGTTIRYRLPRPGFVSLKIYDLSGREVATLLDGNQEAGVHEIHWRPGELASGVYWYRIVAGDFVNERKLLLLR